MASVASQLIQEVTAHAQSDSLGDAREICADGTYFPNILRKSIINLVLVQFSNGIFFFPVALRPNAGHVLLILEVPRSQTTT